MENHGKINKHVGWNKRVGRKLLENFVNVLEENLKNFSEKVCIKGKAA